MAQVTYEIDILGERRVIEKLSDISKLSTEIQQKLNNTKFADANYQSLIRSQQALQGVANQVNVYNQALGSMSRTGSQAGIALQNLNFVIRDSPYFLKDMQLGVLAVGNNINPLIDSFIRLRLEAQRLSAETGKTVTTMSLLKGALVGGVGLSVALSLVVTAFQAFIFSQQTAKAETRKTTEELKKQKEEVFGLRNQYYAYAKERALLMKEDLSDARLQSLNDEYNATLKIKDEYQAQFDLLDRINKGRDEKSLQWTEAKKNLDAENASLLNIASKIEAILFIRNGLFKVEENTTKELEKQKVKLRDLGLLYDAIYGKHITGGYENQSAVREENKRLREQRMKDLESKFPGIFSAQPFVEPEKVVEDISAALESITEISNVAGNAISNAFLSGKNAIDAATQALLQFITQLLVVQSLKGLLGLAFGLPFGVGFLSGIIPGIGGAGEAVPKVLPKGAGGVGSPTVRVTGKITADKNNFIANIKNADNYFKRNEEFLVIGR